MKYITKKAQEIVIKKKKTTFKEVAEILMNGFSFSFENAVIINKRKILKILKTKEKQNIKRRVYDALNVLIATNIIQKQGKEIIVDEKIASKYFKRIIFLFFSFCLKNRKANQNKAKDFVKIRSTLEQKIVLFICELNINLIYSLNKKRKMKRKEKILLEFSPSYFQFKF